MAISSFEKNFTLNSEESVKAIIKAIDKSYTSIKIDKNIRDEIERGEALLKRLYSY